MNRNPDERGRPVRGCAAEYPPLGCGDVTDEDIDVIAMLIAGGLGGASGIVLIVRRRRIAEFFWNEFRAGYGRIGPMLQHSATRTWSTYVGVAWIAIAVYNLIRGALGVMRWLM